MVDFPSTIGVRCQKVVHHGEYALPDRLGEALLGFWVGLDSAIRHEEVRWCASLGLGD